jgi:hypothetical protein
MRAMAARRDLIPEMSALNLRSIFKSERRIANVITFHMQEMGATPVAYLIDRGTVELFLDLMETYAGDGSA